MGLAEQNWKGWLVSPVWFSLRAIMQECVLLPGWVGGMLSVHWELVSGLPASSDTALNVRGARWSHPSRAPCTGRSTADPVTGKSGQIGWCLPHRGQRPRRLERRVSAPFIYPAPLSTLCQALASELDCGSEPAWLRRAGTSSETCAEGCTGFLGLP